VATAIEHFKRALQAPTKSDREEMGLYFEVGNACEVMGDLSEALQYFLKVEKRDPTFRGVRQRVQRLSAQLQPAPSRSRIPQNAEMDEVDRAFDDLFKG
jgi:tetratricopeptide (TPR) repeat protein